MIRRQELINILSYNPITGHMIWKEDRVANKVQGCIAGSLSTQGYITISIDGANFRAQRLIWLYMTGDWPKGDVHHKDGNKVNNKWQNLELLNRSNHKKIGSIRSDNKTGVVGVCWKKDRDKFHAQIRCDYKNINLGYYDNLTDAVMARWKGELEYNYPNKLSSSAYKYLIGNK